MGPRLRESSLLAPSSDFMQSRDHSLADTGPVGPRGRRIYEVEKFKYYYITLPSCHVGTVGGPTCLACLWEMIAF